MISRTEGEGMKVLDLFSGIGGFSLGLEAAGMETVAFCEIEDYPVTILNKHWPDVPVYRDVRKLTGEQIEQEVGRVNVICGGFPCQPFSVAGQQKGKEDDRHLWPEMFRLIQEIRPRWVIGENVAGFVRMALDDVLHDLEGEGYTTQSFVIPACAVGGIHRRDRVWIVAHSPESRTGENKQGVRSRTERCVCSQDEKTERSESFLEQGIVAHSECHGRDETQKPGSTAKSEKESRVQQSKGCHSTSTGVSRDDASDSSRDDSGRECRTQSFRPIELPTQSAVRHRDDGLPDNVARLKALGNAVVPQIPELIGRAIMEVEEREKE